MVLLWYYNGNIMVLSSYLPPTMNGGLTIGGGGGDAKGGHLIMEEK